jgi:alpha-beta hydrolase superfamily lysophospholipase
VDTDERFVRSDDGVEVFYRTWLPAAPPSLVVLLAHGMSEHSGRYARLAGHLVDRGYAVYAPDHRGHGRTAASTGVGRAGRTGVQGLLDDLARLGDLARAETAVGATVLVGHSMGALLAQAFAEQHGETLRGLVLSGSPGASDQMAEMAAAMQGAADGGLADEPLEALAMFNAGFEPARTPYDWLSRDAGEVDAYVADPLSGDEVPMTYGFVASLLAMTASVMDPSGIATIPAALPVLLLTGGRDPVSEGGRNVRALEQRLRDAGLRVQAHYYPEARHEVFNETNRAEVESDLVTWLAGVAAGAS